MNTRNVLKCRRPRPTYSSDTTSSEIAERARGLAQSRTWRSIMAALALVTGAEVSRAQNYAIVWFTIDGGGGTSTGGAYSVSGTIGQPDAGGPLTGGSYSLTGGFWALPFAVQSADAPLLTIVAFGAGQARISWTPDTPGFVLQENTNLATTNWVNSPSGSSNPVMVPATLPIKSYRLRKR